RFSEPAAKSEAEPSMRNQLGRVCRRVRPSAAGFLPEASSHQLNKLGRKTGRVFVLRQGPVELPTDIDGTIWIDVSNGIKRAGEDIRREIGHLNECLGNLLLRCLSRSVLSFAIHRETGCDVCGGDGRLLQSIFTTGISI